MSKSNAKLKIRYTTLAAHVQAMVRSPAARPCQVCVSPRRAEIDACLQSNMPVPAIWRALQAEGTPVPEGSLRRHKANHLKEVAS